MDNKKWEVLGKTENFISVKAITPFYGHYKQQDVLDLAEEMRSSGYSADFSELPHSFVIRFEKQ